MKYLALACGYQFILSYLKTWKSAYKKNERDVNNNA